MTVARLLEEMSSAEYVRWGAYYALKAQRMELEQKKGGRGRV